MVHHKIQLQFLLVILVGILVLSFFILKPFLLTLILAIVCVVVLQPLYKRVLHACSNKEQIAAFLTVFFVAVCTLIPLIFLATKIVDQALQLYNSLEGGGSKQNLVVTTINSFGQVVTNFLPGSRDFFANLSSNLDVYIKQGLTWIINQLGGWLSSISTLFVHVILFFISLYYLLIDGPKLKKVIERLSPLEAKDDGIILERLESAVNSVIKGSLLVALIHSVLTIVFGFTLFGVPNSLLWGALTIITALIPGIGTALVQIPGVVYLFLTGNTVAAIGLLVWGAIVAIVVDNFLRPKLVGRDLQVPSLLVLLSVLGGIVFFGPVGIFLGPLTMSLLFVFISTYSKLSILSEEKE